MARTWAVVVVVSLGVSAAPPERPAPTVTLRLAAIAPDGTSWARLLSQLGEEVEHDTRGQVRVKWLLGGIAGDEVTTLERVRRGELSGLAGAIFCQRVAPSLRAIEIAGLAENDAEASAVLQRLRPLFEEEAQTTPFMFLALSTGFGHRVLFSREPVRSLAELRAGRFWIYDLDEIEQAQLALMGVRVLPLPIVEAGRAYEERHVDGFVSIPWAAVAYRYGVKARYFTDLHSMFLPACMILSRSAFGALGGDAQRVLIEAGARLEARAEQLGLHEHGELLDHVFPREGLRPIPMSGSFHEQFCETARAASAHLGPRLAPLPLVRRISAILAELRAGQLRAARAPP